MQPGKVLEWIGNSRRARLTPHTVHNPGALPQPEFFEVAASPTSDHIGADLTIIFENTFLNWSLQNLQLIEMTKLYDREKLAVLLHSVPDLDAASVELVLRQLLAVGHSIWLTGTNNYSMLDDHFPLFVDGLAGLLNSIPTAPEADGAVARRHG